VEIVRKLKFPNNSNREKEQAVEMVIRPEEEADYRAVEEVTREAFWNVHVPGCDEHALLHAMRGARGFVRELDFVAVYNREIAGNIVYAEAAIRAPGREYAVLTFGPVSVLPKYQNRGIGGGLIRHTAALARKMGRRAIVIYGDPEYYKRFGFRVSKEFGITNSEHRYPAALLVLELYPGALDGINGVFDEGDIYRIDEQEAEEFDRGFGKKEKGFAKSQERFKELSKKYL
jgi:predicted N-acetyltransferase YhbS